ncbi:MAG: pirin family protein [Armatimonadetes bacterium]|nr:pirin family protein [Armatimonadota bacterium]
MIQRVAAFSFAPTEVSEAKGVTIRRAIGGDRLAIIDPFMLLDHASTPAGSNVVGFHRHPHRGIETLSVVLRGDVKHKDSIGNEGQVGPGGAQWMTAGDGIYHEEMMIPGAEGSEMLQLWFSLPRDRKRIPAAYRGAASVPHVASGDGDIAVIAGDFRGIEGPLDGIAVNPTVLNISITSGGTVEIPTATGDAVAVYMYYGAATVGGKDAKAPELVVLAGGDAVTITAGGEGVKCLFIAAAPLNEPIIQYRSFVMNTVEDIRETMELIKSGEFAKPK